MLDTIEMLEAIGSDATLRYASAAELTNVLEGAHVSEALAAAVAFGDSSHLSREFGNKRMFLPQVVQTYS
nr:hypothetical protein [Luteibacter rhizovicinus]